MKTLLQLRDEIRLREASLDDARREHHRGELSDEELTTITEREAAALLRVRNELSAVVSATAHLEPETTQRHPRRYLMVALASFAMAAGVLVWANLGVRQAGQSASGGLTLSASQKVQQLLIEGEADVATGNEVAALSAYQQILVLQPTNVAALTESGWLDFTAGSASKNPLVVARGVSELRQAVALAPRSAAPRLYYAIVAAATPGNTATARREFRLFLTLKPSKAQLLVAQPFLLNLDLRA